MNREAIHRVADCVSPIRFNIRNVRVDIDEDFDPDLKPGTDYQVFIRYRVAKHNTAVSVDEASSVVRWYGQAGVKLRPDDGEPSVEEDQQLDIDSDEGCKLDIEVEFVETYILAPDKEIPKEEDLVEFGKHNVQYHVWPYLREIFQSYGEKLGVGPIPLPHYTMKV